MNREYGIRIKALFLSLVLALGTGVLSGCSEPDDGKSENIELVEPVDATSPICKILEKSGVTPYHTCYEVDGIEEAIAELRREHYVQVSKPSRATAISGCRVSFMYHKDVGLIEIAESPATITE